MHSTDEVLRVFGVVIAVVGGALVFCGMVAALLAVMPRLSVPSQIMVTGACFLAVGAALHQWGVVIEHKRRRPPTVFERRDDR